MVDKRMETEESMPPRKAKRRGDLVSTARGGIRKENTIIPARTKKKIGPLRKTGHKSWMPRFESSLNLYEEVSSMSPPAGSRFNSSSSGSPMTDSVEL